ncbi:hypothetical protein PLESTB_001209800 [Pleodorina starrii]|uniref:Uncharacterized protein n=1 Tax=Pleodorina starrii TaxID=330485 RepID=A0A9W6BSW3_9CHLO|nr:hypothetical protein PLESTM_001649300 [Pleodorina starrii]GLC57305.1 hypothetical protein PLESTB_001209800 [Pleodorina starrii]GLC71296.1 hypothetical protein PLESTF_001100200 [Pleodorina starrii]
MDHAGNEAGHGHGIWKCDGEPWMKEGGSWIGHIAPGVVMMVWGLHWLQGAFRNYFNSLRHKGQEFHAQTTYTLWRFPATSEGVCKAFLPMVAVSVELYFAHRGGWRTMICPAGTTREGHFYGPHFGNWQHAAMYPAFILAGFVDLLGHEVELPPGTQQAFLFLAFFCEALLMGLHKKHTPLDIAVHSVLFYAMSATAVMILAEAIRPRNFLLACGRATAMFVQGGWFVMAAHIMFSGDKAWDENINGTPTDMAPSMMVPIFFVLVILLSVAFTLLAFLAFHLYYKILDARGAVYERTGLLDEDRIECGRTSGVTVPGPVPLTPLGAGAGTSCQV